ncbi:unnamed protein product [Rhizoctonia solani]|uniref:HMG box domain-containing protein n=1 Tax=Rhizoctonia solani TaxID=456999 RepID=A0A8H3I2T1_9AGAM|nr:unnamed protein product [Rhizoctonia solani]
MAHPQNHRTKPPPVEMADLINAMPVAPAAEAQKREIVAKLNDLAAQMKAWAAQVEGFASHLNTLPVQPQKHPLSPSEAQYSSRGAPYIAQQYNGSQQYQFQTPHHQQYSQPADYPGAQLSKVSPITPGPSSATPTTDELEKTGKRRRRTDSTRKKKDPLAPKRPPSAYILYQNDVRKQMQEKYPDLSYPDVLGKISESWQTLEESKKKAYVDMVERDKLRYEDEKTRYNAGQDIPTRPMPRRPLSLLRAPSDPDPDVDAEVEPEGDEEEEPEEEREEQVQPGAKRSKLGSTHEVQPGRLAGQSMGSRPESQSPEAHQPEYSRSQRAPTSEQPYPIGFPHHYSRHVTAPQHTSRDSSTSSSQPQPSPRVEQATLHTALETAAPRPQGVHSPPGPVRPTHQVAHSAPQIVHANIPSARTSGASHAPPSSRPGPPSSPGAHAPSQVTNPAPHITHPSPRPVSHMTGQNPDTRPLPPGFITQFDNNYNAWFYVNTNANPPTPQWTHPADDQKPPPPPAFSPPPGPPPPSGGPAFPGGPSYPQSGSPYPPNNSPYPASNSPYPPNNSPYPPGPGQSPYPPSNGPYGGTPDNRGWGNSPNPPGQYGGGGSWNQGGGWGQGSPYGGTPPPQQSTKGSGAGGFLGKLLGGSKHGSSSGGYGGGYGGGPSYGGGYGGGYAQQQQPPKKSGGMGAGGMLLAGGAGLVGGALLADAIIDHDQDEYAEGYAAGECGHLPDTGP